MLLRLSLEQHKKTGTKSQCRAVEVPLKYVKVKQYNTLEPT